MAWIGSVGQSDCANAAAGAASAAMAMMISFLNMMFSSCVNACSSRLTAAFLSAGPGDFDLVRRDPLAGSASRPHAGQIVDMDVLAGFGVGGQPSDHFAVFADMRAGLPGAQEHLVAARNRAARHDLDRGRTAARDDPVPCPRILREHGDIVGRVIAPNGEEIQVGIITAVIGAPFFIWIVRRQRVREL